jgi:ABC-type transport system involved in cytochrome c biogenesis permease subunit
MPGILLTVTLVLLAAAVLANLVRLGSPRSRLDRISGILLGMACLSLMGILVFRIMEAQRLPFVNMYEFSIMVAFAILLGSLLMRRSLPSPWFDLTVAVLLVLLLTIVHTLPSSIQPLMPALQSRWLQAHVATAIIAYSSFALAFCWGLLYLLKTDVTDADLINIDQKIYRLVVFGFILLSIVIITGAVWAEEVWGNWWSWDPKETWALVTWGVYAIYLHSRRTKDWNGRKSAWLVVIGFIVVLFTLFGVSILLPGLHSYV